MSDPTTREEYEARFQASHRLSGYGLEVTCHVPCPFCAAPEWLVHKLLDTKEAYAAGAVCRECGRGARAEYAQGLPPGHIQFEFVQTTGPDPAAYLPPMRRVDAV